jgi:tRNA A37 N6-isopentenylltransferase MiaA
VATVLRRLADDSPDAAAAAKQLLDNDTVRASRIAETLTKHGHPVAAQSVSRHRRRGQHNGCRCER